MPSTFDRLLALREEKNLPPVAQWHPERQGEIDIVICHDGTWLHEGDPIRRTELVKLFSTILRKDPDGYVLVTPAERLLITVEDAPFQAVDIEVKPQSQDSTLLPATDLLFTTNVQDVVLAGTQHPLRMDQVSNKPYVEVRDGLEACLTRAVYYRLVDYCEVVGDRLIARSDGAEFDLGSVT